MSQQSPSLAALPPDQKILLARGDLFKPSQPRLDTLIALSTDPDPEVSRLARGTLSRIEDSLCAKLLTEYSWPDFVFRYFLTPSHAKPSLLPALLTNPFSPSDAIVELAAQAGPNLLPTLLEHLNVLNTSALEALRLNPAALESTRLPVLVLPPSRDDKLALARGGDSGGAGPRLDVLVSLAGDEDPEIQKAAQDTLLRIPDEECVECLTALVLRESVARYFLDPAHVRPALLAMLLTRRDLPSDAVTALAAIAEPQVLGVLLDQLDMLKTPALIALKGNPAYLDWQKAPPAEGLVLEIDLLEMLIQEMEAESLAPAHTEVDPEQQQAGEEDAEGVYSKIARLSVAKKVVLALRGNKEERAILIRDGSKVVSRAVLGSPKLTEAEVESFATQKNVSQDVLRLIATNRKFIKDYIVVKNLASNPRLPIDVGLALIKNLISNDLRALASNRDVSDTVRKMAQKLAATRAH